MKKLILTALSACFLATVLTGCKEKTAATVAAPELCNTPIADYLYGVEYDDYDFEAAAQAMAKRFNSAAPACSEVRKGNFVGRNLDWYINTDAAAIIKINKSDARYASIGMIGANSVFSNEFAKSGEYSPLYNALPMATTDGINENGVFIGVNVMPTGETSFDESTWEHGKWGHGAAYTNPDAKETHCVTYLARVILDRAKSVADAKQIIESINWYEPKGFPVPGSSQAFHWLISDATTSVVLEFLDNKPYYCETTDINAPSYATIMTNFTNKLMEEKGMIQNSGNGYERYDLLKEAYPTTEESFTGMQDLLKEVWYSKAYTKEIGSKDFWFTEFVEDVSAKDLYKNPDVWKNETYTNAMKVNQANFNNKANWHVADSPLWYTTHTTVYDLAARKFHVLIHEGRDEQKDFMEVSLNDTHFEKPLEHKK